MKILFDHPSAFLLAHGGFQIQIEQTKKALEEIGIEVEWLRWWDEGQKGDVIHYFGRPHLGYVRFARQKGIKVVMSELLTGPGSRPAHMRKIQKMLMIAAKRLLPRDFTAKLAWDSYRLVDAAIALTAWEKHLMVDMFDADPRKIHIVPNGVEKVFFRNPQRESPIRNAQWLVCTATITERKRVLELAEAAVLAKTPVWIIGKPYSESEPYFSRFLAAVKESKGVVRYEGGISERARMSEIYQSARGFVLLSTMESLSLSALEAAASGCHLLLSDLPWARCTFDKHAAYAPIASARHTAPFLQRFCDSPPPLPPPPQTWWEIATRLKEIYKCL